MKLFKTEVKSLPKEEPHLAEELPEPHVEYLYFPRLDFRRCDHCSKHVIAEVSSYWAFCYECEAKGEGLR